MLHKAKDIVKGYIPKDIVKANVHKPDAISVKSLFLFLRPEMNSLAFIQLIQ